MQTDTVYRQELTFIYTLYFVYLRYRHNVQAGHGHYLHACMHADWPQTIGQLRIEGKECNDCKWTWRHVRSTSVGRFASLKYSVQWRWRSFLYFARNYSLPYVQSITPQRKNRTPDTCSAKRTKSICWSASENEAFFWTRADNGDERWVEQQSECSVGDDRIGWKWHSWRGIERSFRKPYRSRAKMVAFVSGYQTTYIAQWKKHSW